MSRYNNDNPKIGMEVDEAAAEVVRSIFAMKLEGKSVVKIAKALNMARIPSPLSHIKANGGKMYFTAKSDTPLWPQVRIRHILHDIRYTGAFAYNMYAAKRIGEQLSTKLPTDIVFSI
jgi:hypothetical protein